MRTLEELNLVDDFLVNSLTSHKVYGEQSARYILECILHRPIGKLRNVIVIFITTYDPFSENRMVYTIKNSCVEVPELEYEDGAKTIFLYTRGKEGNPPEELKQLLHYMEHSSIENASTESLKKLHRMVTAVKRDGEVGLAYMKSFEREARIRREGQTQEIIRLGRKFGKSEEEILALLQEELQISEEWAKELLEKYTL